MKIKINNYSIDRVIVTPYNRKDTKGLLHLTVLYSVKNVRYVAKILMHKISYNMKDYRNEYINSYIFRNHIDEKE